MRHNALLLSIGIITAGTALVGSAFTFREFKVAPVEKINIPAMPNALSNENAFKAHELLDARDNNPYAALGWTTLVPDSNGHLRLAGPDGDSELHTFYTRMRAPKFTKGKIVLKSTSRASLKINGKTEITKETADSLPGEAEAHFTLEPEADYDIMINLLPLATDKSAPEFSLEFIPDDEFKNVEISASPSMKKRVSQAMAIKGERVYSASLSDDGKYLITKTQEIISDNERINRVKLSETTTGRILDNNLASSARWIPGKNAFTSTTARNGKYDIYRTEVPSMKTSQMATGVPDKDFTLTPDGRYLLYYKEVKATEQQGPMIRYDKPDSRIPNDLDRYYIMRYDLETQVSIPITYGGPSTSIMSMTHDGKKLLYSALRQTPDHYPFYSNTLVQVDLNTLKSDTIISNFVQTLTHAVYSPDGTKIFIVSGPDAFDGIGANYAPHEIGNDFDGQGYIYDIASHKAEAMTREFDPAIVDAQWDWADGNIYMLGETGFFQYVYRLDPKSGKITKLESETPVVRGFTLADDSKEWMAYWGGSFTTDGEAYLLNLKTGKSRLVEAPLERLTEDVEFGNMQPWSFTAKDGTNIDGWMCLPPDFDATKKYPLIVYYYGGTSPSNASFYHNYSPQVFASRNYVVYVLNPSGTTGYGQEFSARHVNAWGKRTADEIIEGTKKFCAEHKFINDKKIGCIGASYGGFMTMYLQTQTDIFAAAVSHAGISNVTSYWGEGYWGYSYNAVAAAKHYPWSDPDLFTKQGALFNADKIHTPILLLHGSEDTNVPIGESIQLFNALKILGRDVEFITVEGENHVIRGTENRIIWQNTIMAFFAKYLKDEPQWWNSLYD